jgi:hypothetical protein
VIEVKATFEVEGVAVALDILKLLQGATELKRFKVEEFVTFSFAKE